MRKSPEFRPNERYKGRSPCSYFTVRRGGNDARKGTRDQAGQFTVISTRRRGFLLKRISLPGFILKAVSLSRIDKETDGKIRKTEMNAGWLVGESLLAGTLKCSQSCRCEDDCSRCTLSRDTNKVYRKFPTGLATTFWRSSDLEKELERLNVTDYTIVIL